MSPGFPKEGNFQFSFYLIQLKHLLCYNFPRHKDRAQLLLWLTNKDMLQLRGTGCGPALLLKGYSCLPPSYGLTVDLNHAGTSRISIANRLSSLMQKKTDLTTVFSHINDLNRLTKLYNRHYNLRQGWANNMQRKTGEREGERCLSVESHTKSCQLRWNEASRLLLVPHCSVSAHCPFPHLPSLSIAQNVPISTKENNLDEFHEGQKPCFCLTP